MGRQPKTDAPVYHQISRIRKLKGLTRRDLAEQVGVHYQTIGYVERGEYAPSLFLALKMSELLGKSVNELFSLSPVKPGATTGERGDGIAPFRGFTG